MKSVLTTRIPIHSIISRLRNNTALQRNAMLALASTFAGSAFALIASPILAFVLPRTEYGTLSYLNRWLGLLAAFSGPGILSAISYSVARGYDAEFYHGTILRLRIFLRNSLIVFPLAILIFWVRGDKDFALLLLLGMLLGPWSHALDTGEYFLVGKSDFSALFWRRLAVSFVTASVGVVVAIAFPTALAVFAGRSFFGTIVLVIIFRALLKTVKSEERDPDFGAKTKEFNSISVLGSVAGLMDGLVLGTLGQIELLAAYSLASSLAAPLDILAKSLLKLVYGRLSRPRSSHEWRMMGIAAIGIVGLGFPLVLAVWQVGRPLISMLYPKYPEILHYFPVLLARFVFSTATTIPSVYGLFHRYRLWLRFNIWINVLRIFATVIAVILWGVWGALYAQLAYPLISFMFFVFVILWFERREGNRKDGI